ncbi:MAG: DEAD/DEAH box helicase [Bdellovibrionales bacterium]|nr:DEAD/DEAH box helicase [Bdellovibrionales bacterium]
MTFDQFNFEPSIHQGIVAQGYTSPTPIQEQAINVVLSKKDVLGLAQTGTGKTAAFVLPILQRLVGGKKGTLRALIITPTRELAVQIDEVITALGRHTGLESTTIFGGVGAKLQVKKLQQGVDIVVACPGRLLDHMRQGTIKVSDLEILVLDEADQMFDMGFLPDVKRIIAGIPKNRQSLLFSATMPEEIRSLALAILNDPVSIDVGKRAPLATIEHAIYPIPAADKNDLLLAILKRIEVESVIIFTRTKHRAKRLALSLSDNGYSATSLQGNLSQNRRQESMRGFREGKYQVMVATDIAARGIDISTVSHVINFDIPSTPEAYTHRIGRTGRASRNGEAFTFVAAEDGKMLYAIEKTLGKEIERREIAGFSNDISFEKRPAPQKSRRGRFGGGRASGGNGSPRGQRARRASRR